MELDNLIREIVNKEIRNGRFSGGYKVNQTSDIPHISGSINTQGFNQIEIGYNPEYEEVRNGVLSTMARDVARHEINHRGYKGFNGCPRNLEYHTEKIYEPITEVLEQTKNFSSTDAHYIANALEDSILHSDLSNKFSLEGVSEFFLDVGESTKDKQYTPFYDAHVKLNMFLWGNKKQKRLLAKYYVSDEKKQKLIVKVIQNFLKESGLAGLGRDRGKIREFLNDENNWEKIARIYAKQFSQLMEPSYALPLFNHSGKNTKGRETEEKNIVEGNEFDREMETEKYKMKRVYKDYNENDKIPSLMDNFEALDLLYQSFARKLKLNLDAYTESEQRPVFWHGQRPFNPDRDNLRHLTFGFNDEGKVELKKRRYAETMSIPHKISPRGFPEIRFCLIDTSGSMELNPQNQHDSSGNPINIGKTGAIPWGDNSKYHYALLGWYGFLEYLKQNHLLDQTKIGLGNFSSKTKISYGLEEAKRNALRPQFSGTSIDSSKIKDIFKGSRSLVYTISDGEIENWGDIKTSFIKNAKENYYFHLQIGSGNEMTKDLERDGLNVIEIHNAEDLANKVIEITDKNFRRTK